MAEASFSSAFRLCLLSRLPFRSKCAAARVCSAWRDAVNAERRAATALDLSPVASCVDDAVLAILLPLHPALSSLNLYSCRRVTDHGVEWLARHASLESINFGRLDQLTAAAVATLCKSLTLRDLELGGCSGLNLKDDRYVKHFACYLDLDEEGEEDWKRGGAC